MRERISTPGNISKRHERREIEEGLRDYLNTPISKEGVHPGLAASFEQEQAQDPLKRSDIEGEVENFTDSNFDKLLPVMASDTDQAVLIKRLGITNEDLGLLSANYRIHQEEGGPQIYKVDEQYPEGRRLYDDEGVSNSELLAVAYAKRVLRVDTQRETSNIKSGISHRYYYEPEKRYLCGNDFGMRSYNEEGSVVDGDVTDAAPFISTLSKQFDRIQENVRTITQPAYDRAFTETQKEVLAEGEHTQHEGQFLSQEGYAVAQERGWKRALENTTNQFEQHPKDKELVLQAVPAHRVGSYFYWNAKKVVEREKILGDDPAKDYERFQKSGDRIVAKLLREPSEKERRGASLQYMHFDTFRKPIITHNQSREASGDYLRSQARNEISDFLAREAIEREPDEVREAFNKYRCGRGELSPYYYSDSQVYDFIKSAGLEKAKQVLGEGTVDDRDTSRHMRGFSYFQQLGYDISKWELDKLRKQLYEANKLEEAGLLGYLQRRESGGKLEPDWLNKAGRKNARELFREGKKMYWLAHQVYRANPHRSEGHRFYHQHYSIDWAKYDLTKADVSEEALSKHLEHNKNLIVALLRQGEEENYRERKEGESSATLGLVVQALERGQDIRGVALARDKQRYLEGVIKGEVGKDNLEFALADWPADWRKAVSDTELKMYYEYADDYVLRDPNGLVKYAEWRTSEKGREWDALFEGDPNRKSDLDFRLCLGVQTDDVREWYKQGAEYVEGNSMQEYLLRFNATRNEQGRLANLHDALYWVPNIQKLEPGEARAVLKAIETMDDNREFVEFLPRYDRERDQFRGQGAINSLRELKKRVFAIESNIDLSDLPPEIIDITSAPGFNMAALERMRGRADFTNLIEGRLDKEQPFQPHRRFFAGRDLTEALREGLGSRKQKIQGTAQDVKRLFHSLSQMVKGREIGERNMQVTDLFEAVPVDMEEDVIKLLREQRVDIGPIVEAQVHAKSDPEGWVCGNYTDCCMPFGASNNDDYMANPSTQYFTVKYNGRIIAQSVAVDGRDRRDNSDVVILDNIEVANNYKNLSPLLAKVYQTYWTEYTDKPVKVGTGYSDLTPPGGQLEENNYESKTRLSYSDATGSRIYNLPKMRGVESMEQTVTFANLSERDAGLITRMESESYEEGMRHGQEHIGGILQRQRELEVPGAAASFIVRQGREEAGYLLVLPEESEINPGEQVAHVHDMAVLPKFRGSSVARRMMERVLDTATAYDAPIEAEARASTSYALLMNDRVRKWFERKGFRLTKNEKMPEYMDGEDFYFVRFDRIREGEQT